MHGFGAGYNRPLLIVATMPDVAQVTPLAGQNGVALIRVIPKSGPSDPGTASLVHRLRDDRAAIEGGTGARILVGGTTASNIDVSAKLSAALPIFLAVVVGLAFVLLTFAFRTILVPLKSILGFLLSMAAALGAQVAVFQWGWGQHLLGITAMIMFSIFVAFMFTSDPTIKTIGFSFATGVFLDAFVVRLTLVSAVMALVGSKIWYHPRWFARRVPDPDIEGQRLEDQLTRGELVAAGAREGS